MFTTLLGEHFVHTALLAGAVVAIVSGAIGVFVVMRGLSFAVHAISELGFTGAAGALVIGIDPVIGVLGGSLFVENVWGLPGLGNTALTSLTFHDLPTVEGITVFVAVCVIVLNLVVDTTYTFIDPRIRLREAH